MKTGVVECAICQEPITEENIAFHREELCKIPIREKFKDYLLTQRFSEEEIQKAYRQALIKFKDLGHPREITIEIYTRDMLVLGYSSIKEM
jgi:hypothetical protein